MKRRCLVVVIILLFLGIAVQLIHSADNKQYSNLKQVQTIEPLNNPDVKQLLNQHKDVVFNQDIINDIRNIIIKDKGLSERKSTFEIMNNDLTFKNYPNSMCYLLLQIFGPTLDKYYDLAMKYYHTNYLLYKFYILLFNLCYIPFSLLGLFFNCGFL